jgi:hypothetical protein
MVKLSQWENDYIINLLDIEFETVSNLDFDTDNLYNEWKSKLTVLYDKLRGV